MNDTTTTAVATTEQPQRPRPPALQAGGTISAMIPTDIDQAFRLARALALSGMTPKAYGNDENKCFVGILAGAELGLAPFQALQSIAVIGNNPAIWGDGALALVQASGLLADIEETDDGHTATCRLVRKDRSTPIVRTFSMDDAKKAGLSGKSGPWSQYPQRMRQMRARSWAMRDGFADVLKGLHIAEEVRDRPGMVEQPQTTRLSSDMLAEQAGVTVEQQQIAQDEPALTERDIGRHDDQLDRLVEAEDVQDAEIEEVDGQDDAQTQAAQQTLNDIDGELDTDEADDSPDPREAVAAEIIAALDKCANIVDLRAHWGRNEKHLIAMPEDVADRVKAAFKAKEAALKGPQA